jgi:apolipoprotein D and lipocalin family protein
MKVSLSRLAFICLALASLSACAPPAPQGFRDLSVPMGATTRFDPVKFAGTWLIIASFTPQRAAPLVVSLSPEVETIALSSDEVPQIAGFYREGAPGELLPVTGASEPLVVMWVDEDFGTAAVGTPSGSFGAVLNRTRDIRDDRAIAARDVFDFYGWDVSRLRSTRS